MAGPFSQPVAFSVPFLSEPERANEWIAKNVQLAIEELAFNGQALPFERIPATRRFIVPKDKQANLKDELVVEGELELIGSLVIF